MTLRDVTEGDLPILFEHQREPDANRMVARAPRERDAFMTHWRTKVLGNPSVAKKAVVVNGEVAGNVVAWNADDGKRLVGYWVGQAYWSRGVATAALAELVASHELTRPLYAYVAVQNVGSRRVLEKCGFRRDGATMIGPDGVEEALMRLDSGPAT